MQIVITKIGRKGTGCGKYFREVFTLPPHFIITKSRDRITGANKESDYEGLRHLRR